IYLDSLGSFVRVNRRRHSRCMRNMELIGGPFRVGTEEQARRSSRSLSNSSLWPVFPPTLGGYGTAATSYPSRFFIRRWANSSTPGCSSTHKGLHMVKHWTIQQADGPITSLYLMVGCPSYRLNDHNLPQKGRRFKPN